MLKSDIGHSLFCKNRHKTLIIALKSDRGHSHQILGPMYTPTNVHVLQNKKSYFLVKTLQISSTLILEQFLLHFLLGFCEIQDGVQRYLPKINVFS